IAIRASRDARASFATGLSGGAVTVRFSGSKNLPAGRPGSLRPVETRIAPARDEPFGFRDLPVFDLHSHGDDGRFAAFFDRAEVAGLLTHRNPYNAAELCPERSRPSRFRWRDARPPRFPSGGSR